MSIVYIENKGYSLIISDGEKNPDIFLIKANIQPNQFNLDENIEDKKDFINLIEIFLNKIYEEVSIQEYEQEHLEFVFFKMLDLLKKDEEVEIINKDSKLYSSIESGFIKLDLDVLNLNQKS